MPTPQIIERVRQLHSELGETQPAPPAAHDVAALRKQLDVVMLAPDDRQQYTSLGDPLRAVAANLRAHHPRLAGAIQGLIDELVAAGL